MRSVRENRLGIPPLHIGECRSNLVVRGRRHCVGADESDRPAIPVRLRASPSLSPRRRNRCRTIRSAGSAIRPSLGESMTSVGSASAGRMNDVCARADQFPARSGMNGYGVYSSSDTARPHSDRACHRHGRTPAAPLRPARCASSSERCRRKANSAGAMPVVSVSLNMIGNSLAVK
jgi:hypothetical protein